jgi:glycine cleavage system regulatory protein
MRSNHGTALKTQKASGEVPGAEQPPGRPAAAEATLVSSPVDQLFVTLKDGKRMKIIYSAEDRVGVLHHLCTLVLAHGVNFEEGFGGPLQEHGCFSFIVRGEPEQLRALERDLKRERGRPLPRPRIVPAQTFDMHLVARDRPGLLCDITGVLKDHDINIVTLAGVRFVDPETGEAKASIEIRLDVPGNRLEAVGDVFEELAGLTEEDGFRVTQRTPASAIGSGPIF